MTQQERFAGMLAAMMSVLDGRPPYEPMTPELAAEAQRRAQEWLAQHPADSEPEEGEKKP